MCTGTLRANGLKAPGPTQRWKARSRLVVRTPAADEPVSGHRKDTNSTKRPAPAPAPAAVPAARAAAAAAPAAAVAAAEAAGEAAAAGLAAAPPSPPRSARQILMLLARSW